MPSSNNGDPKNNGHGRPVVGGPAHRPARPPRKIQGDARKIVGVAKKSIDVVLTSPPYWRGRDYGHPDQLGRESTPEEYITSLATVVDTWRRFLRPHASVFINIADSFQDGFLAGIPARFEIAIRERGWKVANHIIWAKDYGVPEAKSYRLARRHESIFHLVLDSDYYFDMFALGRALERTSNPGNVWRFHHERSKSNHLAPFPSDLARYVLHLACPERVCSLCGKPYERRLKATAKLDKSRPQARRALARYKASSLTEQHLAAVRAVGISDSGKGKRLQTGATRNSSQVRKLAAEAKAVLGGYFREFTFAKKRHAGWIRCRCKAPTVAGKVLDPFMGSGTTLRVASELGLNAIGVDLTLLDDSTEE